MKRFFTLIELVVVIVVMGILAAIVIPNIKDFKKEATLTAIESNARNIQVGVDMFALEFKKYPSLDGITPTIGEPKQIDFSKLTSDYVRSIPKTGFYWIDYKGQVIYSDVDSPINVQKTNNLLTWEEPTYGEAVAYEVFGVKNTPTSAAKDKKITFIESTPNLSLTLDDSELNYENYLISSISENNFRSPGVGVNSTYKGIILERNEGDGEEDDIVVVEEEFIPFTPTGFSDSKQFATLSHVSSTTFHSKNILKNGENTEVFYNSSMCCIQNNLYKEVFNSEGIQVSKDIIQGYSGNGQKDISNLDNNGNRYLFRVDGLLYKIKPDNTAELVMNTLTPLNAISRGITKPGIEIEGNFAYLAYHSESFGSKPYLAILDLTTKKIISNKVGIDSYMSGYDNSNIIVTKDYIYTSALNGYTDSRSSTYIIQWDKLTGNKLKHYYTPTPQVNNLPPTLFADSSGGIWFTEARTYQDGQSVKVKKFDTETFNTISTTISLPDLTMYRVDGAILRDDGSIQLFYEQSKSLRSVTFK